MVYLKGMYFTMKEIIKGGLGDNKKDDMFNSKQLSKGVKIEMEHTTSKRIAKEIAKDHLTEFPNYYTELEKLERRLRRQ